MISDLINLGKNWLWLLIKIKRAAKTFVLVSEDVCLCLWPRWFELFNILELIITPSLCSRSFLKRKQNVFKPCSEKAWRFSVIDRDMACLRSLWQWLARQQRLWLVIPAGIIFPFPFYDLNLSVIPQNLKKTLYMTPTLPLCVCVCVC